MAQAHDNGNYPFRDLDVELCRADAHRQLLLDDVEITHRRAQEQARLDDQAARRRMKAQRKQARQTGGPE